jgi:hypothetical protein
MSRNYLNSEAFRNYDASFNGRDWTESANTHEDKTELAADHTTKELIKKLNRARKNATELYKTISDKDQEILDLKDELRVLRVFLERT